MVPEPEEGREELKPSIRDDKLLWIDLETTGSNVEKDCIIEVGAILTTSDLREISRFQEMVLPTPEGLGRMMMNHVVRQMHEKNGLLDEIVKTYDDLKPIHDVTRWMLTWLGENGADAGRYAMAGSGVGHFDKKFVDRYMPQLGNAMRYWVIDIGVIRRATEMWTDMELYPHVDADKAHRAMDDIEFHLAEARWFQSLWKGVIH